MNLVSRLPVMTLGAFCVGAFLVDIVVGQSLRRPPPIEIVPMAGHAGEIFSVRFSPDGKFFLTAARDNTQKLWDARTSRLLRIYHHNKYGTDLFCSAFSPDGRMILSGGQDFLELLDIRTGQAIRKFSKPLSCGDSLFRSRKLLDFSPSGHRFVVASAFSNLGIYNINTGQLVRNIATGQGNISSVIYSPDGRLLLSGCGDVARRECTLKLWNAETGRLVRTLTGHKSIITSVAFSPDGGQILSGGGYNGTYSVDGHAVPIATDNAVRLWDTATGALIRSFGDHTITIQWLAFAPDGERVLSADDHNVRLWDVRTGRLIRTLENAFSTVSGSFSPDARYVVTGDFFGEVTIWNVSTGKVAQTIQRRPTFYHKTSGKPLATSAEGAQVLSIAGGRLERWDARYGNLLDASGEFNDTVRLALDGRYILSSRDQDIQFIATDSGQVLGKYAVPYPVSVALSPDEQLIAASSSDREGIDLFDAKTSHLIRKFPAEKLQYQLSFSPDGRHIVSTDTSQRLFVSNGRGVILTEEKANLWDVRTGSLLRTFDHTTKSGSTGDISTIVFSPDGRTLLTAHNHLGLRLWHVDTGQLIRTFTESNFEIQAIAFSTDGQRVFAGGRGQLTVWDVRSGRMLRSQINSKLDIEFLVPFKDGRHIVTAGRDASKNIWSVDELQLLATLVRNEEDEWLALTPEGFFAASEKGANMLSVVQGLQVYSVDQFYQSLYRPDLVREKLAGDPRGLVREAAARLDLSRVLASGNPPVVAIVSPSDGMRATADQVTAEVEVTARDGGIGRVEWRINGVTIGIETPLAPSGDRLLRIARDLVLDDGENEIEVVVYNRENLVASVPARAHVMARAATAQTPTRMFVLVVGLNDYADKRFRLNYAVPDAKSLAVALQTNGKELYSEVNVVLVIDGDVRRTILDAAFAELAGKIRPTDVFVFFAAGHGKTIDGRYYFLPQDFKLEGDRSTLAAVNEAVASQGITQEEWQAWFAAIPARRSVLLFDTCEAGTLIGGEGEAQTLERGAANDRLVRATGRTILTASAGDKDALEGFRNHGLFTYSVLEALERADSDRNGRIDVSELAAYVHAQVTTLSERVFQHRQVPQVRITSNYTFASAARVLPEFPSEIIIPEKSTHAVATETELLVLPEHGAPRIRKLEARTPLTLVKSEGGWTLVAREGRPIGYIATRELSPLH